MFVTYFPYIPPDLMKPILAPPPPMNRIVLCIHCRYWSPAHTYVHHRGQMDNTVCSISMKSILLINNCAFVTNSQSTATARFTHPNNGFIKMLVSVLKNQLLKKLWAFICLEFIFVSLNISERSIIVNVIGMPMVEVKKIVVNF